MSKQIDLTVEFLNILGDKTRLEILMLLKDKYRNSKFLQDRLHRSQSTISQQLKTLKQAQLIKVKKNGVKKSYIVKNQEIYDLIESVEEYVSILNQEQIEELTAVDVDDVL